MSDKPLTAFQRLHRGALGNDADHLRALHEAQFEEARVRYLMTRLGFSRQIHELLSVNEQLDGIRRLTFAAFNEQYPTFPFVLGSHTLEKVPLKNGGETPNGYHIHEDVSSAEPARFKNFAAVPFVAAYERFYEDRANYAGGRKMALVVPRSGMGHGLVIHNDDTEQYWQQGLCWVYKFPKRGTRLYVQPFVDLVMGLHDHGNGWQP